MSWKINEKRRKNGIEIPHQKNYQTHQAQWGKQDEDNE